MKNELFSKVNNTSSSGTNNEVGSGLGLLLVNDFVAQHGGTIDVESEVGLGTTFKFTIPVVRSMVWGVSRFSGVKKSLTDPIIFLKWLW